MSSVLRPDIFINSQKVYEEIILVILRNLLKKVKSPARIHLSASCKRHQAGCKCNFYHNVLFIVQ